MIVMWLAPVAYCLVHYQPATTKVSEVALTKLKAAWHDNVCDDDDDGDDDDNGDEGLSR